MKSKKFALVWDSTPTHVNNKAKDFYLKNGIEIIVRLARSLNLNTIGGIKNKLDKCKVNKIVKIIVAIQKILKEFDHDIISNCVDSMVGRILKSIDVNGDLT